MKPHWILAVFLLAGCKLAPKQVEFFQRKVQAVPQLPVAARETQRQAAEYLARKTEEVKDAAIATQAFPEVVAPAEEAGLVASALSNSLGPPETAWKAEAEALRARLQKQEAQFNVKLEKYKADVAKDEGKAIEGTGLFRIGYFSYLGLILAGLLLLWLALRIYGLFNPVVGLGAMTVGRVASSVASRGLAEVVEGGQKFQRWVTEANWPQTVKDEVAELFTSAQKEAQSRDVRDVVRKLVGR